jgi:hypothetical protein
MRGWQLAPSTYGAPLGLLFPHRACDVRSRALPARITNSVGRRDPTQVPESA